ncbi:hypothetical protein [Clostridium senegalense]|uniref:hypothetical protein n=1 Tax=Clostridium senegalense TaxID=1465809 RepID=UPI0002F0F859|nr:hypothetical protein [Clostridium senegalense]MBU5225588.1 hypothetical protein [Clostridium senegalense]
MAKKNKKNKNKKETTDMKVIGAVAFGVILGIVIPFWGWIIAIGLGIISAGWKVMEK